MNGRALINNELYWRYTKGVSNLKAKSLNYINQKGINSSTISTLWNKKHIEIIKSEYSEVVNNKIYKNPKNIYENY